ncbi:glycine betaine ABC transporter substrate-binding protein [Lichenicola sp.]|uniref:glycine betaine ABC transporter substrate-binding protein n=1 Tax=Lichenicola sp. TaxID=2804529 RepID=UPI003B00AB62
MSFTSSLTLGHLDTRQHEAAAAAVLRVLEAHDLEVELVPADRDGLVAHMQAGRIDLLATAWLPDLDAGLVDPAQMEVLGGVLYRPFLMWAVPAALVIPGLVSIADLHRPEIAAVIDTKIVLPPWLEPHAQRVMTVYELGRSGYRLEVLDAEVAFDRASALLDAAAAAVLPLSQPHALAHGGRLRPLEDPEAALNTRQEARLLLRRGLRASLDPDLMDELEELTLGNPVVSALEHAMRRDGMTADEAAEAWQRGRLTPRA